MKIINKIIGSGVVSAMLISVAIMPSMVSASVVQETEPEDKVTICHRTNSVGNPYVRITVDKSAVDGEGNNDHTQHTGPVASSEEVAQELKDSKTKWGDIIPPFGEYAGYNWDEDGQDVYKNDCAGGVEIIEVVPAEVTFIDPTCDDLGSYTIPEAENVDYLVDGEVVDAGTYEVENGTSVTVTAEAHEDYYIGDEVTDSWTNEFNAPTNCGSVLGDTDEQPQVTSVPLGAVNAGVGANSSTFAIVGLLGSLSALMFGLFKFRKLN